MSFTCIHSMNKIKTGIFSEFLCCLRSIATHRDHFVRRPSACLSVRLSHFPKLCFAGDTCIPRNAATMFYQTWGTPPMNDDHQ